jgi:3-oxoacyl-[acyl-carrier protein] reductase
MASEGIDRPIAIVTGASRRRGIGAAVCIAMAEAGADVFFTHWIPYDQTMSWGAEEDGPSYLQERLRALGARC